MKRAHRPRCSDQGRVRWISSFIIQHSSFASGMLRLTALVSSDAMSNTTPMIILTAVLLAAGAGTAMGDDDMLDPGQPFPAFELPAHDGTTVSSSELAGSTYLLFYYPKADTGG